MNLEQARAKLASVSNGTATKHPKVLVSELCAVVKFLLDDLAKRLPEDLEVIKSPTVQPSWPDQQDLEVRQPQKVPPPWPDQPKPEFPSKRLSGNAGDAE